MKHRYSFIHMMDARDRHN